MEHHNVYIFLSKWVYLIYPDVETGHFSAFLLVNDRLCLRKGLSKVLKSAKNFGHVLDFLVITDLLDQFCKFFISTKKNTYRWIEAGILGLLLYLFYFITMIYKHSLQYSILFLPKEEINVN